MKLCANWTFGDQ